MGKITKNCIIEVDTICRAVFENSMDAILLTAPDGRIFAANPAACEMYGMTQEEIISAGRNGLVDLTDDNIPYLLAERKKKGEAIGEFRQKRKDGSIFLTEVSSKIFKEPNGEDFTIMIIRDITKKNETLGELQRSKDFAESLIETANVIFVQLDISGKILNVNKTFENISGYNREYLLGKDWFKILVPKNRFPEVWEEYSRIINFTKTSGTFGNPILTKKGEERDIHWSYSCLIKEGKVTGTISFGIDITSRKKAEQALIESELWLNRIFNSVDYALIAVTPTRIIVNVNEATERIFGYSKNELINQSTDILHVDHNHYLEFGKMIREAFERGKPANFEFKSKRKNGEIFPTEHLVSLIKDEEQNEIGIISFVRDLTERKLMELKLKKRETELKRTTKELRALSMHLEKLIEMERSQIARDLHDDLGQKLTALNLNISWIKSRMGVQSKNVSEKFNSMAALLNEAVKSMHDISYKLRPGILEDLGLKAAIEWQLSDFSKSTGIHSTFSFDPKISVEDHEISLTIFRIVQEGLTNVVRHSKATAVTVDASIDETVLKLVISDNGVGIEKNKIKDYKSFGLIGMRERVKSFGGEFHIKGKKGEGTIIIVKIPFQ